MMSIGGCSFAESIEQAATVGEELVAELDKACRKSTASILIVDDQAVNLQVAEAFLREDGYEQIRCCDSPEDVPELVRRHSPDVILLDVMMPRISGLDVLRFLRGAPQCRHVPVIILTALTDLETKSLALQLGATDFLTKPLDPYDLLPRVRNAIMLRTHQRNLEEHAQTLEQLVRQRTAELTWTQIRVIHCLARAAERRDNETGRHAVRVGRYAQILAQQLGQDRLWCQNILLAAMLHDVGKIGVPDAILLKPGKLSRDEFQVMKEHCGFGEEIIDPIWRDDLMRMLQVEFTVSTAESPLLELAASIAATHHERWNGSGYPRGLKGEEIPLEGRITAVADVFDALGSMRPYKPAFSVEVCRQTILDGSGTDFDPLVTHAFAVRFDDILAVRDQLRD